ncbi:MAG: Holliday junction branch migration protein RuvA, partial [Rickettsiales bacterium]|nr:Holliday junction branch migration protein RuvA [Rickettsiales bacterium]
MFGKLQGRIDFVGNNFAIVMAGGIGFKVLVPSGLLVAMHAGEETVLWTETIVREDSISLVGFEAFADQELFIKLTGVSGIGPKLALAMLGACKAAALEAAIANGDALTLTSIPGVGKKVAERIIVELKGKV